MIYIPLDENAYMSVTIAFRLSLAYHVRDLGKSRKAAETWQLPNILWRGNLRVNALLVQHRLR